MANYPALAALVALARAGATEQALRQLEAGGFDMEDAAALALQGRLFKDLAVRGGAERVSLLRKAAAAYDRAGQVSGSSYPLINAATLYRLAGDAKEAADRARSVLDLIEAHPEEPETPYWRCATRAEALLLLCRHEECRAALSEAIALAPRAWEDHASTLRQFALILGAQCKDAVWLDSHRPPRSLHFGGHMSFDAKVVRREHLDEKIAAVLEEENVGFGFGALAAGADIIIAEALLERGAELHVLLPGGVQSFASVSVDPLGKTWRRRFDAVLARAETVRAVRPFGMPPDRTTIAVADEIAMGAAVINARRLESRALQLLVLDQSSTAEAHADNGHGRWAEAGWNQRIITAPREPQAAGPPPPLPSREHRRLALLAIRVHAADGAGGQLAELAGLLGELPAPAIPPYFTGDQILFGYAEAIDAARAATALAERLPADQAPGIGGHYGIADPVDDPFSGTPRLAGEPAELAGAAAASAPPGSICVTEDFAAALAAANPLDIVSELIGELDDRGGGAPVALYALKARISSSRR